MEISKPYFVFAILLFIIFLTLKYDSFLPYKQGLTCLSYEEKKITCLNLGLDCQLLYEKDYCATPTYTILPGIALGIFFLLLILTLLDIQPTKFLFYFLELLVFMLFLWLSLLIERFMHVNMHSRSSWWSTLIFFLYLISIYLLFKKFEYWIEKRLK